VLVNLFIYNSDKDPLILIVTKFETR